MRSNSYFLIHHNPTKHPLFNSYSNKKMNIKQQKSAKDNEHSFRKVYVTKKQRLFATRK